MSGSATTQKRLLAEDLQIADGRLALLMFTTIFVSLVVVSKVPNLLVMLIPEIGRLLQYSLANVHLEYTSAVRYQAEVFQNLIAPILARSELFSLDPGTWTTPLGARVRSMLTIAACDISVIIPTLNEEKYLPKCLRSVTSQSRNEPVEIVVVDGGSKDRTLELAKPYADKILLEPDRPVGAARNVGAKHAEGDILAFIDADTIASEEWLAEIMRTFRGSPRAVGVTGPTLPHEGTHLDKLAYHIATGWAQKFSLRLGRPHVAGFNCAYRRDAFWGAGGFDENRVLSEDVVLSMRMRHQGPIAFNPNMVAYTSLRRIKQYGYPYLTTYYAINAAMMLLFDRTLGYPQVR